MFKFLKFNNYSLENFEKNQIWCNYYSALNDPFECWCIEKTGIPDPERERERYDSLVAAWGYDPGPNDRQSYYEYCSEFDHPYSMKVINYIESARFSCFCKRVDNLLMWSHYADGLRGFCLEFKREQLLEFNAPNVVAYDVVYQDTPPIVDTMLYEVANDQIWYHEMAIEEEEKKIKHIKNHVPDKLLPEYHLAIIKTRQLLFDLYIKMLCYKPIDWIYEEEIRLIYHTESDDKSGEPLQYPKSALKSIIIGEKAKAEDVEKLMSILKKNELKIPVKQAKRHEERYRIEII